MVANARRQFRASQRLASSAGVNGSIQARPGQGRESASPASMKGPATRFRDPGNNCSSDPYPDQPSLVITPFEHLIGVTSRTDLGLIAILPNQKIGCAPDIKFGDQIGRFPNRGFIEDMEPISNG